ncbi:MAG TPA: hypothetical protein VFH47_01690, partial [Candidatus Thermoplasmatota archaeon]|nr:hypothetical protein [Candidatus Thermoplasmatota archaeon]
YPNVPQAGVMHGTGPMCPRCGSTFTQVGGVPTWAVVTAVAAFFVVCVFSLLFLLVRDDNRCMNCAWSWK